MQRIVQQGGESDHHRTDEIHRAVAGHRGYNAKDIGTHAIACVKKDKVGARSQPAALDRRRLDCDRLKAGQQSAVAETDHAASRKEGYGAIGLTEPDHADNEEEQARIHQHMLAFTVEQPPGERPGNENKGGEHDKEIAGEWLHP
ncbi:hypothetical protein D3C77_578120 [compost metagenome]